MPWSLIMDKFLQKMGLVLVGFILLTANASSADVSNSASKTAPLVIESQVKGSQEQPNVIYIMPWQGVDQVIEVKGKKRTINLPHFKPINPKLFKQQVRFFANKKLAVKAETGQ